VIYTLAGCRPGDRCIIERSEAGERTRCDDLGVANDWLDSSPHWEGRIVATKMLTSTFEEAAENSRVRRNALVQWRGSFARDGFAWLAPPVLNACTRIAVEMCPARGILCVVGYELAAGRDIPDPVTPPCRLNLDKIAALGH
jgi:hypothetical protein